MSFYLSVEYLGASHEVVVRLYCPNEPCHWYYTVSKGSLYNEIDSLDMEQLVWEHQGKEHSD